MLGNRAHGWKLAAAIGLVLAACAWSKRRGEDLNPVYWRCRLEPERFDGTEIWTVRPVRVGPRTADGFTFAFDETFDAVPVRGRPPESIREGDRVWIRGIFRRDGSVDLLQMERIRPTFAGRRLVEAGSVLVLLAVMLLFVRGFRVRWDRLSLTRRKSDG